MLCDGPSMLLSPLLLLCFLSSNTSYLPRGHMPSRNIVPSPKVIALEGMPQGLSAGFVD